MYAKIFCDTHNDLDLEAPARRRAVNETDKESLGLVDSDLYAPPSSADLEM